MAEVAADMREGLLALAVGAGLQVMTALMDADVTALAGPKGKHNSERVAIRHGRERVGDARRAAGASGAAAGARR
jgi:putative transposase